MRSRRILVTGGAGFIGSAVAEQLLTLRYPTTILDNLSTGRLENLRSCIGNPIFTFVRGDVLDSSLLKSVIDSSDIILHFAARVGVKRVMASTIDTVEDNVLGAQAVLSTAAGSDKHIFLASTSEVYGTSSSVPFSESEDLVLGRSDVARWCYAFSKLTMESLAFAYGRERGLKVTIMRFFNIIGPNQLGTYGMVVPNMIQQALRNEEIPVFGDGLQSRCFCDIRDAVRAIISLIDNSSSIQQAFNIGSEEEVSIMDLAGLIRELCRSSSEIKKIPFAEAFGPGFEDMPRRVPDLRKIHAVTGWLPRYSLRESLKSIIER